VPALPATKDPTMIETTNNRLKRIKYLQLSNRIDYDV
jgi:hypothetical protein